MVLDHAWNRHEHRPLVSVEVGQVCHESVTKKYPKNTALLTLNGLSGDPNGIRTRAAAVKGRCPRPLDDRVVKGNLEYRDAGLFVTQKEKPRFVSILG